MGDETTYKFGKSALSHYVGSDCLRRLRLDLYRSDAVRRKHGAPEADGNRIGFELLARQGHEFERLMFERLIDAFPGRVSFRRAPKDGKDGASFLPVQVGTSWDRLASGGFVLEAEFGIPEAFLSANGLDDLSTKVGGLKPSNVRPDILVGVPACGASRRSISPDGRIVTLDAQDPRTGIRVVDVKMAEQPTPGHFVELAFYGMTLAELLREERVADRFFVLADAAIWPGGARPTKDGAGSEKLEDAMAVFEKSLETLPAEVVLPRVRSFLSRDLPKALEGDWKDLPWHIGPSCRGCDFLGYRSSKMRRVESEKDLRSRLAYQADHDGLTPDRIALLDGRRAERDAKENRTPIPIGELLAMKEDGIESIVPGSDDRRCWSEAERAGDLSRVMEMNRAAAKRLKDKGVRDIAALSGLPHHHEALGSHQTLRGARRILVKRAGNMLAKGVAEMPEDELRGTSAIMPKSSDVAVYLQTEFDVGSKFGFVFGVKIAVNMPTEVDWSNESGPVIRRTYRQSEPLVFVAGAMTEEEDRIAFAEREEKRMFVDMMGTVAGAVIEAGQEIDKAYARLTSEINLSGRSSGRGAGAKPAKATVQFYVWDRRSLDHLSTVVGRHLHELRGLEHAGRRVEPFLWMVPPDELLQDADFVKAESAVTVLADVARTLVAAPLPHHYGLIGLANLYPQKKTESENYRFAVDTLYFDPLSDQMPSERGHEIWNGTGPILGDGGTDEAGRSVRAQNHLRTIDTVVKTKLRAMESVRRQLASDLKDALTARAPRISTVFSKTDRLPQVSEDGQVVYQHARLLAAAAGLEVDETVAMPPNRREAKGRSIRLLRRIDDVEAVMAERRMARDPDPDVRYWAFGIAEDSLQARVSDGDFDWSFLPESRKWLSAGSAKLSAFMRAHPDDAELEKSRPENALPSRTTLRRACQVTVESFDRRNGIVVFSAKGKFLPHMFAEYFKFAPNPDGVVAILDPLHTDFFVESKLKPALARLGVPKIAHDAPLFEEGVSRSVRLQVRPRLHGNSPGGQFVWNADAMHGSPSGRSSRDVLAQLERLGPHGLNPRQLAALTEAVERRLSVVWGPPGTGKSHTSKALLAGLMLDARASGRPIRIAVTGPNWTAIDNLAEKLPALLAGMAAAGVARFPPDTVRRLRSRTGDDPPDALASHVVVMGTEESDALLDRLRSRRDTVVVAGTADQLFRLANPKPGDEPRVAGPDDELFDFMLVDEASQMDLAHAIVAFATLDQGAQLAIVGDDLQMPPIHPVEAPSKYARVLGSIYDFYRHYRKDRKGGDGIPRTMLSRNFRSNAPVVDFFRNAGYDADLASHHPSMRMELAEDRDAEEPPLGPLGRGDVLSDVLDPRRPLVAIVHGDETATQSDPHEAGFAAALVERLWGRLRAEGKAGQSYATRFFASGVGIVTPHRAQRSAILDRLHAVMPDHVDRRLMAASIDTVERFQGQERQVMIASYGIGDVDQIAAEEEFLFSLNRFNVIVSRAKSKLVVVASRKLVEHLPRDPFVLRGSLLLKHYFSEAVLPEVAPVVVEGLTDCTFHSRRDADPA